jgi:hypothetical protein
MRLGPYLLAIVLVHAPASAIGTPPPPAKQQVTVQVADFQYRKRRYRGPVYVYRERFTPGQHWQPWPAGRHHRYWHGGLARDALRWSRPTLVDSSITSSIDGHMRLANQDLTSRYCPPST